MSQFILAILALISFSGANASGTTSFSAENTKAKSSILFQIIQIQVAFDNSTIESAELIPSKDSNEYGIQLKLTKSASEQFASIIEKNIGKRLNIVLNDRIISSPTIRSGLGKEFLVGGLTKEEAEKFLRDLK